ncbi:hypothetical protein NSTC745_03264 [Nostoc sp. DSM 114161]
MSVKKVLESVRNTNPNTTRFVHFELRIWFGEKVKGEGEKGKKKPFPKNPTSIDTNPTVTCYLSQRDLNQTKGKIISNSVPLPC